MTGSGALRSGATGGCIVRLFRQRLAGHRFLWLALQRFLDGPRYLRAPRRLALALTGFIGVFGALSRVLGCPAALRRRQIHSSTPRLRKPDCDSLFRRACAMIAMADCIDLRVNKLSGLGRRGFALSFILSRFLDGSLIRHGVPPPQLNAIRTQLESNSSLRPWSRPRRPERDHFAKANPICSSLGR